MTIQNSTRRQLLKAAIAAPVLTIPAVAVAAPADAELRRLWTGYLAAMRLYDETRIPLEAADRAMMADPELPSVRSGESFRRKFDRLSEKHGRTALWERWSAAGSAVREIVDVIRATPAESLFGIGVKLNAMEGDPDPEDFETAVHSAVDDIERLTGNAFTVPWPAA